MADNPAFNALCDALEKSTSLDGISARGTIRIAIKNAGLDPAFATAAELVVVVQRILPDELESRGEDVGVCDALVDSLLALSGTSDQTNRPERVFGRMAALGTD